MNQITSLTNQSSRLGFHYYPDSLHYRDIDINVWLPELIELSAGWLVLQSSPHRAIPEDFIHRLVEAHIQPIIQFSDLSLHQPINTAAFETLLNSYARWGCKAVQFYDQPNSQASWSENIWNQNDIVELFLDRWIPLAALTLQSGMAVISPPLLPGGAYWDTAFLFRSLEGLKRRRQKDILENLVLGAYGWSFGHSLNWGAGGPQRWNHARPYYTPADSQDQRGFRTHAWYQAIAEAVFGRVFPCMVFQAGLDPTNARPLRQEEHLLNMANQSQAIARLAYNFPVFDPVQTGNLLEPLPSSVLACNLFCLTASPSSRHLSNAYYLAEGIATPAALAIKALKSESALGSADPEPTSPSSRDKINKTSLPSSQSQQVIEHYLLIPSFDWGVSDYHLEAIKPFIKKHHPTVGFSSKEALLAKKVTVINDALTFPESLLAELRDSGCQVDWIKDLSGIELATILAQR